MIKAALFDIDNTLVWIERNYIYNVIGIVLEKLGEEDWSKEEKLNFWFGYNRNSILMEKGVEVDEFWPIFIEKDRDRISYTHLFNDVGVLKELKNRGLKIGLVTGCHEKIAEKVIGKIGREYIDQLVVGNDAKTTEFKAKPDPESINACLYKLGVRNIESIHIGDGEEDIMAAKKAGVLDVLVERETYPLKIRVEPSHRIRSLYESLYLL